MTIVLDEASTKPIYQQIVEAVTAEIKNGALPVGYKLPTVRELADELKAARGTIKHAYDLLEQSGLVYKMQGSGTFVSKRRQGQTVSKKEQALYAIDRVLDQMQELGFSLRDIQIFLNLKLREREGMSKNVQVGIIDCSPEALMVIGTQLANIPHVDVYEYSLQSIMSQTFTFNIDLDLIITTTTHYHDVRTKLGSNKRILQVVMDVPPGIAAEFARIPRTASVGVLCLSSRYSEIIMRAVKQYCDLEREPEICLFGNAERLEKFLNRIDHLILPSYFSRFCTQAERLLLSEYQKRGTQLIYQFQVEKGSLLYIAEQIEDFQQRQNGKGSTAFD